MALDFQTISAIVFLIALAMLLYLNRKKLHTQGFFPIIYFSMLRTRLGINWMNRFAKKFAKPLRFLGYAGIVIGFLGMVFLAFSLIQNLYNLITAPAATPGVGLVLPFKVKGAFFVPFWYWIISIFIIAVVHEYAHGVIARAHKLKVKSSGFAFLGIIIPIIPAAFVEPDEKALKKRPHSQQLSVFAAGPFSNILLAFLVLAVTAFAFSPIADSVVELSGVEITGFIEGDYPAKDAGISEGEIVNEIDGKVVKSVDDFSKALEDKNPGDVVSIRTDKGSYDVELGKNPEDESQAYLGVYVQQETGVKEGFEEKYGSALPAAIIWVLGLLNWLIILNLGIGLFNLVPIGPLDGGRMLQLVLHRWFDKKKGDHIWHYISVAFLLIVIANIGFAFVS